MTDFASDFLKDAEVCCTRCRFWDNGCAGTVRECDCHGEEEEAREERQRLLNGEYSCYWCSMASSGICRQHADDVARAIAAIEYERLQRAADWDDDDRQIQLCSWCGSSYCNQDHRPVDEGGEA